MKKIYIVLMLILTFTTISALNVKKIEDNKVDELDNSLEIKKEIINYARNSLNSHERNIIKTSAMKNEKTLDEARGKELLKFSEPFFETFLIDEKQAVNDLFSILNEQELLLIGNIFKEFKSEYISDEEDITNIKVGYIGFKVYIHISGGWFVGEISRTLVSIHTKLMVFKIIAAATKIGSIAGTLISAILAKITYDFIIGFINELIIYNGWPEFTRILFDGILLNSWIIPFKEIVDLNIAGFIFFIIDVAGGEWVKKGYKNRNNFAKFRYN